MNVWMKRILWAFGGAGLGYAYYYYIGCVSGTCPITSNPYISTAYGAMIGLVLFGARTKPDSSQKKS